MNEQMQIEDTKFNRFTWIVARINAVFFAASLAFLVLAFLFGILAGAAGAQTSSLFDTEGYSYRAVMIDGESYVITTVDHGDWSSSFITGSGGSGSSFSYDLGEGYDLTTITAEPSLWGGEDDTMKTLLMLETYRQIEDTEDQEQLEHDHWLGCGHDD